jgi:hypothetical protein
MREDLGVAPAAKRVSIGRKRVADVEVVVQLAVLNGPDVAALVRDRLMTAFDVHDAQAANAERDAWRRVRAAVVRAAVCHCVRHPIEDVRRDDGARLAADLNDTADPAHRL